MDGGEVGRIDLPSQPFDIDFHPSSNLLVTGLISGKLELYGYGEEEPRRQWQLIGHTESCRSVRFSDAGRIVLSASPDKSILISDVATGQIVTRHSDAHSAAINRLIVLSDSRVATGDDDGAVKLWDLRQNNCCHTFEVHEDFISDMAPSPTGSQLLVTSGDGSLSICNVRQNRVDARSEMEEDELLSVTVLKYGRKVVCGTQAGILLLYSWGEWNGYNDRVPGHPCSVDALVKVDEDTVITGSSDGLIRVVSILPNKMLGVVGEHSDYPIERLAYSFDKRFIASASHDKSLKLWDVAYLVEDDDEGNDRAAAAGAGATSRANGHDEMEMEQAGQMDSDGDNEGGGGGRRVGGQRGGRNQQPDNSFFDDL